MIRPPVFFPELEAVKPTRLGVHAPRAQPGLLDPCARCPLAGQVQVKPVLPPGRKLTAVGIGPGGEEVQRGIPHIGPSGQTLRAALTRAGFDVETEVGFANLGRCLPAGGFESPEWGRAAAQCWFHLLSDLGTQGEPLLLLGGKPLVQFCGGREKALYRYRGLWVRTLIGRMAFVTGHPARLEHERDPERRAVLAAQFEADVHRMADRIFGREQFPSVQVRAVHLASPEAAGLLRQLAVHPGPWFFDIETYDAQGSPSRRGVAVDRFHPDFRVRGVAVATGPLEGTWYEFDEQMPRAQARALLDPAFASPAEKGAFVSDFDENGLLVSGWVTYIANVTRDPWLHAIALDRQGGGHALARLTVDVLGEPQPKGEIDPSRIRELSLEQVAAYSVNDACCAYRLDAVLRGVDRLPGAS